MNTVCKLFRRCSDNKPNVIFQEEEGRTRYTSSEPTVKILKRPTNGADSFVINGDSSRIPKLPVKTLQQVGCNVFCML